MTRLFLHIALITSFLLTIFSCTERIDIELDKSYERLAVDGRITRMPGQQYVLLTKTADYFANVPPEPVSEAKVTVNDGEDTYEFLEDSLSKGLYKPSDDFIGVIGKTYHLEIRLVNAIGDQTFYEAIETMPPVSDDIDSVAVEYESDFELWFAGIYAQAPPRTDFYMFNGMRNGMLITDSLSRISLSDDRLFNGNYTNGSIVLVLDEEDLMPGDTFTLILSNITEQYYDHLYAAQIEVNPKHPLFSGPPANVKSNLTGGAVGYFAAFPSEFTSTIVPEREE